jgi:hypothetical protein
MTISIQFFYLLDSTGSNESFTPKEYSKVRCNSVSSSTQRPHSLESETVNEKQKKPDKESSHTLSWNDVSGECDTPGCQRELTINFKYYLQFCRLNILKCFI